MTSQDLRLNFSNTTDGHSGIPSSSDEVDISQLLRTIWRGRWFVIICAAIATALGGWYAYRVAIPQYTATASVVLESRQEQVVNIESVMTGISGDQASMNTEVEVLKSRGLIEKLVAKLDLENDPEFNPELQPAPDYSVKLAFLWLKANLLPDQFAQDTADRPSPFRQTKDLVVDNVRDSLSISNVRQSLVFEITATTWAPEKSASIANTLAELYILDQLSVKFEATESATAWLTDRVGQLQVQLEAAESAVKEFNAGTDLISPETLAGLSRQIKELRDRVREAREDEIDALARIAELEDAAASNDLELMAVAADDGTITQLGQEIAEGGNGPSLPLRNRFETRYEQILSRAQLEADRLANQIRALENTIVDQEKRVARQSVDLVTLQQLQREAEASRLIYEFFLGRLKETSVQQGIQQADSRVLSQAVLPVGPSAPRKRFILALSLVLGTLFGSGLVLAREMGQNTFRDGNTLEEKTGYTVIGQIPAIPARRRKNVLKYLTSKPASAAAEAIRNLRTSVLLSDIDNPPQVIMSTSSIPGEGKTTQSLALAQNLTGLGKKVLLVEGDIRKRIFAEYFDIQDKQGLIAVLSGEAKLGDAVTFEPSLKADILIGEKTETNAADIFSSERFSRFLSDVRSKYDYIIIDTPPVLAVPDARVIGKSMDAVIYTVKWDSTSQRQVREGLRLLENVQVRVTGLVLSQINAKGMKKYGYGEAYGSYGDYHQN